MSMSAPRTDGYVEALVHQDPRRGQLSVRFITKAVAAPAGVSHTLDDRAATLPFDPLLVLSSPENAFPYFYAALGGVDPLDAAVFAAQMVRFALEHVTVGGRVRFGILMSASFETVYVVEPPVAPPPPVVVAPPPAFRAALEELDEWIMDYMFRASESIWGPAAGTGLSEEEIAALEKERFAGEAEEEEAPSCSVCLEEYVEGDVITALSSSCSHKFHNVCIAKWLRMKRTCPVCRAPVAGGGRQAEECDPGDWL